MTEAKIDLAQGASKRKTPQWALGNSGRQLEKKLKAVGVRMSSAQALEALRTMLIVDIRVGAEIRRGVTAGNHLARQILAALGINDREPPQTKSSEKMPA